MKTIIQSAVQLIRLNKRYSKRLLPSTAWAIGSLLQNHLINRSLCGPLSQAFNKSISIHSLKQMKRFYKLFPDGTLIYNEISWSHYQILMSVNTDQEKYFYLQEALANHWTCKQLHRQIKAAYYERMEWVYKTPVKRHYVFEFTLLSQNENTLIEFQLETMLIEQLQALLLELGKGFAFIGRQKRLIMSSGKAVFIDLVFYHYLLDCFVLIDIKTNKLDERAITQMDKYVRLFDEKYKQEEDQPTIGIILCPQIDQNLIKYSIINENKQLFACTYQLHLPTKVERFNLIKQNVNP